MIRDYAHLHPVEQTTHCEDIVGSLPVLPILLILQYIQSFPVIRYSNIQPGLPLW